MSERLVKDDVYTSIHRDYDSKLVIQNLDLKLLVRFQTLGRRIEP